MITARGETYRLKRYPRIPDSPYEYADAPDIEFSGRPASKSEDKDYRVQQGVNANNGGIYVVATNLPSEIKPHDRIYFMGKMWSVVSVGYFYEENLIVNASAFSEEYIVARCPKGLALQ